MINKKIYIFVDGTNLYAAQFKLFGPDKYLDFSSFIGKVEKSLKITFDQIYFYASYSPRSKKPSKKEKAYLKNEALFYESVKRSSNVVFFKGYRSKTSGQEKEVDVKLTADLITFAFLKKFDNAYLFSGDADFLQALLLIRKFHYKKKLYLLCLQNRVMYQGIFNFKTYIVNLRGQSNKLSGKFRNVEYVVINERDVVKKT